MSRYFSLSLFSLILLSTGCSEPSAPAGLAGPLASIENAPETSGPVVRATFGFVDTFIFDDTPDGEEWILIVGLPEDISKLPVCGGSGVDDELTIQRVVLEGRTTSIEQRMQARAVAYNLAEWLSARSELGPCAALQTLEPLAVGTVDFVLQDNDILAETRNNVWGWVLTGSLGSYAVHQVVRFRIGPTTPAETIQVLHFDSYIR